MGYVMSPIRKTTRAVFSWPTTILVFALVLFGLILPDLILTTGTLRQNVQQLQEENYQLQILLQQVQQVQQVQQAQQVQDID